MWHGMIGGPWGGQGMMGGSQGVRSQASGSAARLPTPFAFSMNGTDNMRGLAPPTYPAAYIAKRLQTGPSFESLMSIES